MILEIIAVGVIASALGGGIGFAAAKARGGAKKDIPKEPLKIEVKKFDDKYFLGLRGGVFIVSEDRSENIPQTFLEKILWPRTDVFVSKKDDSGSVLQSMLEQRLVEMGMDLYALNNDAAVNLMQEGAWDNSFIIHRLDIIVAGTLIIKKETRKKWEYPTIQHVDTETGMRFDQLPSGHRHFRGFNSNKTEQYHPYFIDSWDKKFYYYFERDEEFACRREREKRKITLEVEEYRAELRCYGPNGTIRGACICSVDSQHGIQEALQKLLNEIIEKLMHAVPISRVAHDVAEIIPEL